MWLLLDSPYVLVGLYPVFHIPPACLHRLSLSAERAVGPKSDVSSVSNIWFCQRWYLARPLGSWIKSFFRFRSYLCVYFLPWGWGWGALPVGLTGGFCAVRVGLSFYLVSWPSFLTPSRPAISLWPLYSYWLASVCRGARLWLCKFRVQPSLWPCGRYASLLRDWDHSLNLLPSLCLSLFPSGARLDR